MRKIVIGICVLCTMIIGRAEAPAQVAGTWALVYGKANNIVELVQSGDKLTGKLFSEGGATHAPITGTVQGANIQFGVPKELARNPMAPQFEGTVAGATMKGLVKVGPMRIPFTGTRKQ